MKGTAMIAIVMMVAVIVALAVGFSPRISLFSGGEGSIHKTSLQSNIYVMEYALDAANIYANASLDYSVYQACYDNLRNAGLSPVSSQSGDLSLTEQEFYQELSKTIEANMAKYTKDSYHFMADYPVTLPSYGIMATGKGNSFLVSAIAPKDFSITRSAESGETITLGSKADLSKSYSVPCYSLFQEGQFMKPSLQADLDDAFKVAMDAIEEPDSGCSDKASCESTLSSTLSGDSRVVKSMTNSGYSISASLKSVSVSFSSTTDVATGEIMKKITASATRQVSVKQENPGSDLYPVWSVGKTSFEPMELVFKIAVSDSSET